MCALTGTHASCKVIVLFCKGMPRKYKVVEIKFQL